MAKDFDLETALAELRREFADALPARLDVLRTALNQLRADVTAEGLRAFHVTAHALQGTAGSYQAHELVPHATRVAMLARGWIDAGQAPGRELEEASQELDALHAAAGRYRQRAAR
jgi:HPt (histidine-containing phosphotransfer) domain-containing protein